MVTTTLYDSLNRTLSVTTPDNSVSTFSYSGNQTTATDPALVARTTATDAAGRLTSVTEAGPVFTCYKYDALDDLTNVYQAAASIQSGVCNVSGAKARTFNYDPLKRLTSAQQPESGTISYSYDNNGNVLTRTDANTNKVAMTYDALNRMASKTYTVVSGYSTPNVTLCYDGSTTAQGCAPPTGVSFLGNLVGHLTQVSSSASVTSYPQFDVFGDPLQSVQTTSNTGYQFYYTYNLANAMTTMTLPSHRLLTWNYDIANRPISLQGNLSGGTTYYTTQEH